MADLLTELKKYSVVVADTGDINSIEKFAPRDATTNPSLITAAARLPARNEPANSQLLRPMAIGLIWFSHQLLSIGTCASSRYRASAGHRRKL